MSANSFDTDSRPLASVDPVWEQIRSEAATIVKGEPALGGFIYANVLNHDTLEDVVINRIAQRLNHRDVTDELITQTFSEALAAMTEFGATVRADIVAHFDRDPACSRLIEPVLYFKGFHAIQTARLAGWLWRNGRKDFALYLQSRASTVFGVDINPGAELGKGLMFDHATGIVIGETAVVGDEVSILHNVTLGGNGKERGDRHPKVRHGVLIGAGAKILGNLEVGHCSRVAAGSVVLKDVPPCVTVAGVPAKVVGNAICPEPARTMNHLMGMTEE